MAKKPNSYWKMTDEEWQKYADQYGISGEAYKHLFINHTHDHDMLIFGGEALVTMSTAIHAILVDRMAYCAQMVREIDAEEALHTTDNEQQ
jgi:hypothetical protein